MTAITSAERFRPELVDGLDEPVRRYFCHAIRPGASLSPAVRLRMTGHVKAGAWLPFTAEEELDGRSLRWSARVRWGPLTALTALDRFGDGEGSMELRVGGRLPVLRARGPDTIRSAAGRAAVEAFWSPAALLPQRGVRWLALADDHIVATWPVPPEWPEVHFRVDGHGRLQSAWLWRRRGSRYVPCGGTVLEERRFGDLVLPSRIAVAWGFGTTASAPFFRAELLDAVQR